MPTEPLESLNPASPAGSQRPTEEIDKGTGPQSSGGVAKKAKAVRVRQRALADLGPGARGVADAVAATGRTLMPDQIMAVFGARIQPVRPSAVYRLSVVIVTIVMVLLPLIYIGLIGLIVAALYYHAVYDIAIFNHVGKGSGASKGAILIYLGPLIAGAMVVAFMLKPLFARPVRREQVHVLEPEAEALLHAFVARICESVGAQRPKWIEVDSEVNASARREGFLMGIFGNTLVLRIGLPLVAGLNLRQFAGVLAHEFGHFSQGAGMRLAVLIMSINSWFARVVYERDSWDENLAQWSTSGGTEVMIIIGLIRLSVWLTRRILWVLMWVGHLVSVSLRRQMEYDADRYEARMVGGAVFGETMERVRLMGLASNGAHTDLQLSWRERRMPDNFPKLVLANIPQIPKELVAASQQGIDSGTTSWLDFYPCDKDRMAHAAIEEPGQGIFHLEGPATDVFNDFDALARVVSYDLYKSWLGSEITDAQLYSVAELVESQAGTQEGLAACHRFFLRALVPLIDRLSIPRDYPTAPADPAAAEQSLVRARIGLEAARAAHLEASAGRDEVFKRLSKAQSAIVALEAGMPIKAAEYGLEAGSVAAAERARSHAEAELRRIDSDSQPFGAAAAQRLVQTLAILEVDAVADQVLDGADRRAEARAVYPCVAYLGGHLGDLVSSLFMHRAVLIAMAEMYQSAHDPKPQPTINGVLRAAENVRNALEGARSEVPNSIDYPFEHAQEDITLAQFAFSHALPDKDNIGGLLQTSEEVINHLHSLYLRSLGRLALTAEMVEQALGLPPLEVAETDEEKSRTNAPASSINPSA